MAEWNWKCKVFPGRHENLPEICKIFEGKKKGIGKTIQAWYFGYNLFYFVGVKKSWSFYFLWSLSDIDLVYAEKNNSTKQGTSMKEFLGQTDMNDGTWCMCVFAYSLTSLKKM